MDREKNIVTRLHFSEGDYKDRKNQAKMHGFSSLIEFYEYAADALGLILDQQDEGCIAFFRDEEGEEIGLIDLIERSRMDQIETVAKISETTHPTDIRNYINRKK